MEEKMGDDGAMLPSLAQMLPPRDPHDFGMPPAGPSSLLTLESQGSFVSQPVSQENSFLLEQPLPAPGTAEQNPRAQERAPRKRSPVSRPYCCEYENFTSANTQVNEVSEDGVVEETLEVSEGGGPWFVMVWD
ncbi:Krueppel-like factor 17 [Camelus dromedarius]|uniref:Krueppel-like factor 17 n=1 Tax=Camelus dromedarius TaxID=9838 RepID=A0A5N4DB20_CAMDR|nr:Krueppel-like factor 17 [Camelus dromedarius]